MRNIQPHENGYKIYKVYRLNVISEGIIVTKWVGIFTLSHYQHPSMKVKV